MGRGKAGGAAVAAGKKASEAGTKSRKAAAEPGTKLARFTGHDTIIDAERDAVTDYQGSWFQDINRKLRTGVEPSGGSFFRETVDKNIKLLDSAISKTRINEETTVWRGVSLDWAGAPHPESLVGATFHDGAYYSTSLHKTQAAGFAKGLTTNPVLVKITVPKGSKGLPVHEVGQDVKAKKEMEVLLPRNSKIRIKKVTKQKDYYLAEAVLEQ